MFSALVERLRGWRDDAFNQRLFESASFWGDKLLCMSGIKFNADDLMDAFCLARIFYAMQQFHRADHMLNQRGLVDISIWSRHLSAQCNVLYS